MHFLIHPYDGTIWLYSTPRRDVTCYIPDVLGGVQSMSILENAAICGSNIIQQEDVYQSILKMIRSGIPHVSFTPSITSQDLCYVQDLTPVALMAWIPPEPWTPGEPSGQQEKGPVVGHGCDPN